MKRSLIALFCAAIAGPLSAQPNFKLTCSTPSREYTELSCSMTDNYILNQTARSLEYADNGMITMFSNEHKRLGSFKYNYYKKGSAYLTYPLLSKDKMFFLMAPLNLGGSLFYKHVFAWGQPKELTTIQEYNTKNLTPIGGKKMLSHDVSKKREMILARSTNGVYLGIIERDASLYNQIKYTLLKNGEAVFTQDIKLKEIPKPTHVSLNIKTLVISDNGDLVFAYKGYYSKEPYINILMVPAATKQANEHKLKVAGKVVPDSPVFFFDKDGNLVVASTYALPEKDVENHTGIVVEILSPSFNLLNHSEVPFSSEVLSKCTNSIGGKPNSLYNHYVQNILPVKDGYVIVTEQQTSVTVAMGANNTASKTAYGNLVCICLDGQLKEQKQLLVRSVNQKMNFVIFEEQGSYVSNNRVYIFHPGNDDKVKNTDDEFDLYCTTWEGGTANPEPKTVEVPRPYKDLHMYPSDLRVLAPNKLLIFGRGNGGDVWTTMEITE